LIGRNGVNLVDADDLYFLLSLANFLKTNNIPTINRLFLFLFLLVVVGSRSHACRRVVLSRVVKLGDRHPGEVSRGTKPVYEPGLVLYANCEAVVVVVVVVVVVHRLRAGGQEIEWWDGGGR